MPQSPRPRQLDLFGETPAPSSLPDEQPAAAGSGLIPPDLGPEEKAARMAELRDAAMDCRRCHLCETRTTVVFGEGNPAAPLVFVGEGPGETEDATGRPFVGRAGKLLDQALLENGLTRDHVYICNIIKCRAADYEEGRLRNRVPQLEEVAACSDWLDQQLRLIRPLVIICLGSPAANALIHRNFRISQERGRWFEQTPHAPWVSATLHPAWVLRQHGEAFEIARRALVEDIAAARRKVIEVKKAGAASAPASPTLF